MSHSAHLQIGDSHRDCLSAETATPHSNIVRTTLRIFTSTFRFVIWALRPATFAGTDETGAGAVVAILRALSPHAHIPGDLHFLAAMNARERFAIFQGHAPNSTVSRNTDGDAPAPVKVIATP